MTKKVIKLSANENCYGCSPLALEAIQKKYTDVHLYPEANPIALKGKLADKYGVTTKNIVVGAGSVSIIDGLIQTCVAHDEEVLTFENSFIAYGQFSKMHNRNCLFAPQSSLHCDPENLLPYINAQTRLIFIANPNNPTGTIISHTQLEGILIKVSKEIIVVIDEAYSEYVTDPSFPNSLELQKKHPNLVILHSFSKIYGLAGLRIGYGIMDELIATKVSRHLVPFSMNYLSYTAAIAALDDMIFLSQSAKANAEERDYLYNELIKLGYHTIVTHANYIYVWFDRNEEKKITYDMLFHHGIIICDLIIFGQEKALRITIGYKEANKKLISTLCGNII